MPKCYQYSAVSMSVLFLTSTHMQPRLFPCIGEKSQMTRQFYKKIIRHVSGSFCPIKRTIYGNTYLSIYSLQISSHRLGNSLFVIWGILNDVTRVFKYLPGAKSCYQMTHFAVGIWCFLFYISCSCALLLISECLEHILTIKAAYLHNLPRIPLRYDIAIHLKTFYQRLCTYNLMSW